MSKKKEPVLSPEELGLLIADFKDFLRTGVPYNEWRDAPAQVKAALVTAAKELDAERLLSLVQALSSREGLLEATSVLDGGQNVVDFKLHKAIKDFVFKKRVGP